MTWSRIATAGLRLLFFVTLCGAGGQLAAQDAVPAVPDGTHLRIHLITIGQGPAIWERFGHNAIVVEDTVTGEATAYDYGRFDFAAKGFILRFVQGRLTYWMASTDAHRLLGYYQGTGRQIVAQRVDLEPAERAALRDVLRANDTEATRYYEYDYYLDNCSTRVRDALDRVLGGAVAAALKGRPTGTTFRWHTLRVTANNPAMWTGLDLALGPAVDRPIDAWEESFMPQKFAAHFATVTRAGPDGAERPVVVETDTLDQGGRWPEPQVPPRWWPWFLLAGLLIGGSIWGLRDRPGAFVLVAGFFSVVTGLAGFVVTGLWAFTDHAASYGNINVLTVPVTGLLLAYFLPRAVREGPGSRAGKWARGLAWLAVVGCVVVAVLSVVGVTDQRPWEVLALVGPGWVGVVTVPWPDSRIAAAGNQEISDAA